MSNETTITPEVVPTERELQVVLNQNNIPQDAALSLQTSFSPSFIEARNIIEQSSRIVVTDASQKLQIKLAREYRLALRAVRVAADKKRKDLKDASLRQSRAIDGFYNILLQITDAEENRLASQEEFVERQEAARKAALKAHRTEICQANEIDPNLYNLEEMTEETFQNLVAGMKLAKEQRAEAARKAEAERIEREAAEAKERERIRLENERLKKEAEEKEAALKAEREKARKEREEAEAAAKAERERIEKERQAERERVEEVRKAEAEKVRLERERIEKVNADRIRKMKEEREAAEKKAQKEKAALEKKLHDERIAREHREAAEREKAEAETLAKRKAEAAPDREKLKAFAEAIRAVPMPELIALHVATSATVIEQREKLAAWIEKKAEEL